MQRRIEVADGHRAAFQRLVHAPRSRPAAYGSSLASAFSRCSSVSARIISRMAAMRSPSKNMCSVRHRPMPSAPNFTACSGVVRGIGVGADAQLAGRVRPAHEAARNRRRWRRPPSGSPRRRRCRWSRPCEIQSPSWKIYAADGRTVLASSSILISPQPETQQVPMPRATTAAWEVMPPRTVRMPCAASMPSMSSGEVSRRTRTTFSPVSAACLALPRR